MADFLAAEKEALGDDADLFASGNVPSAPSGMDDFPDITGSEPASAATQQPKASSSPKGMSAFPALGDEDESRGEVRVTGFAGAGKDEDMEQFESSFPDLSGEVGYEAPPKPVFNALGAQPYGASPYPPAAGGSAQQTQSRGPAFGGSSILPAPPMQNTLPATQEDTEPIRQWREKQAEEIKRRDEADRKRRDEMKDKAEKQIDLFYDDYNKMKEKNIRENKEKEAQFLEKLNEGIAKGTAWERITEMISLENSQSKTIRPSVPGGSDLARMKEILLALRREGDKAPGAAGF